MFSSFRVPGIRFLLLVGGAMGGIAAGDGLAQTSAPLNPLPAEVSGQAGAVRQAGDDDPVTLDRVEVEATSEDPEYDATGMGSYEQQLRDPPFSNDLISIESVEDDPLEMEIAAELQQIANPSPVDLATGDSRLSLRGFPTPLRRNGFAAIRALDMLNTRRTIIIQGALVPVLGRAAPGGIQDFITARPRARAGHRFDYAWTSHERQSAALEITGPAVPKRAWHRVAANWSRREGPEQFAATETRSANGALTWRHGGAASTLFAVDFQQVHATAAPGIPEYREAPGEKIVGRYLPLAGFNALGPEAGVRRRSTAASVLFDGQPHPKIALRAGAEAWWRGVEQDRFTTSLYNVASRRFEGTREPRHLEQPQHVRVAHFEVTGRFNALHAVHKLMFAASHTWGEYGREEFALPTARRNALPASVRLFNPLTPDYFRPEFSRDVYSRVLTNRDERARYTAAEITERAGIANGRLVVTAGLRQDYVGLVIDDHRSGAARPHVEDAVEQLTYHFGVNYQAVPSRLLIFASTSTAFEPSSRVDARTGRVQGNEMTRGYEAGVKGRLPAQQIDISASAFSLFNEDISRRNPLYDDPIFDANQTQPQLVAAGEETFAGGKVDARWRVSKRLSFSGKASYARAITTASPDLPEEVGRAITRLPPYTASAAAKYAFDKGWWEGVAVSASLSYISAYTANYEDERRHRLDYPGYRLVSMSASRSFRRGKYTHGFGVSVRNVLDVDLLRTQHRLGAGRELGASYRLMY